MEGFGCIGNLEMVEEPSGNARVLAPYFVDGSHGVEEALTDVSQVANGCRSKG